MEGLGKDKVIHIPDKVNIIIEQLQSHGFEAYAVGGCVRDMILGRVPQDWDITTSAKPHEVKQIFNRTIDTGIQHGTVTVLLKHEGFEVTTYRIDGEYNDNRHPNGVEFTKNLIEDLKRRDFTINALAYNTTEGVIDIFDGLEDIKKGRIRCVGEARERFEEDALRILRAIRFSGQLGFIIEEKTEQAMIEKAENLTYISKERIRVELDKLLVSNNPGQLFRAYELGITRIVLPEFDEMVKTKQNNLHHSYNVGIHSLKAVEQIVPSDFEGNRKLFHILRWAALLHDVGKPGKKTTDDNKIDHFYGHPEKSVRMSERILKRLKFDNETIDLVKRLIQWHDYGFILKKSSMRKAMNKMGMDLMPYLFVLMKADILAQSSYQKEEKLEHLKKVMDTYKEIKEAKECITLRDLNINGSDLIKLGWRPGKQLGKVLQMLLQDVLEYPEHNTKEQLIQLAQQKRKEVENN